MARGSTVTTVTHAKVAQKPKAVHHSWLGKLGTREVIIAGDLNTEMLSGSCVEAFVAAPVSVAKITTLDCATDEVRNEDFELGNPVHM